MRIALVGPELEENLALRYIHSSLLAAGHEAMIFDFHAATRLRRSRGRWRTTGRRSSECPWCSPRGPSSMWR